MTLVDLKPRKRDPDHVNTWYLIPALIILWCALCCFITYSLGPWLSSRCGDGPVTGIFWTFARIYSRAIHRVEWVNFENLPEYAQAGGKGAFIVIANHTGGIDPVLIQCGMRRHLRWLMWKDMFTPLLGPIWRHERMIPVSYGASDDAIVLRESIRHLRSGEALGIFPEGAIARPPEEIRPFQPGVGLLSRVGKAPILLFWVHGVTYAPTAWGTIFQRSYAKIEYLGEYQFSKETSPTDAAETLREAIRDRSGWPLNDESIL